MIKELDANKDLLQRTIVDLAMSIIQTFCLAAQLILMQPCVIRSSKDLCRIQQATLVLQL